MILIDEEIRGLMAEEYNAREARLLPDCPDMRNEHHADNVYEWPSAFNDKCLIDRVAKVQLKKVVEWLTEVRANIIFQGRIEEELWENLVKEMTNGKD